MGEQIVMPIKITYVDKNVQKLEDIRECIHGCLEIASVILGYACVFIGPRI